MHEDFAELADAVTAFAKDGEVLLAYFAGEVSDFVRFNRGLIRQPGNVTQRRLHVELIRGQRHAGIDLGLSGEVPGDLQLVRARVEQLREMLDELPEDPYLLYSTEPVSGEQVGKDKLPPASEAVEGILRAGENRDMVGIYAAGGVYRGFANSLGQRNWFSAHTFHFDWCLYHRQDKAVKSSYGGFEWDDDAFAAKVDAAADQLDVLARDPETIQPGEVRAYLAPAAMEELLGTVAWGGFGLKDRRTKRSSLLRMSEEGATLSPAITLRENTREGMAPNFEASGFVKPAEVVLIEAGALGDCLVSPRSAREYDAETNGASEAEMPESLDLAGGDLAAEKVVDALDTGIYVNRLWYLNYSDRPACRITGMTRFATFWVENGRIVAPLDVMRFDDTIYRMLGENLEALTRKREFLPSVSTYGERDTASSRLPGALLSGLRLTL